MVNRENLYKKVKTKSDIKHNTSTSENFLHKTKLIFFVFVTFIISISSIVYLRNAINNTSKTNSLIIKDILVTGLKVTKKQEVGKAIPNIKGRSITSFNAKNAKLKIEELPWVKTAIVSKKLPDTIFIKITERTPIALWFKEGHFYPIDSDGAIIDFPVSNTKTDILILEGLRAPIESRTLFKKLSNYPYIKSKLIKAEFLSNRRWDITIKDTGNFIKIKLPAKDIDKALYKINKEQRSLLKRNVKTIDIRDTERTIVILND